MTPTHSLACALVLAAVACASRPARVAAPVTPRVTGPGAPHASTLVAASLRVFHGDRVACALAADGRITLGDEDFARLDGDRVRSIAGEELARVEGASVHFAGASRVAELTADGLAGPDGQRLAFDPEGHPVFTAEARAGEAVLQSLRVEGITAATRATAAVLVGVLMFRMRAQRADAGSP
jgi:hypothetical protein